MLCNRSCAGINNLIHPIYTTEHLCNDALALLEKHLYSTKQLAHIPPMTSDLLWIYDENNNLTHHIARCCGHRSR